MQNKLKLSTKLLKNGFPPNQVKNGKKNFN